MTDQELCKALRTGVGLPLDHCEIAADRIEALAGQAATYKAAYDEAQVRIAGLEAERDHFRNGIAALKADNDRLTLELAMFRETVGIRADVRATATDVNHWVKLMDRCDDATRAEAVIAGLEAWLDGTLVAAGTIVDDFDDGYQAAIQHAGEKLAELRGAK